jgi:predicted RNA-binding Zn-ribbon protein involved in translation (DUF1610 family)
MADLCVMCGRILPDECGSHVCHTCELTAGINFMEFYCPKCGHKMELFYKQVVSYRPGSFDAYPQIVVDLIYHCDQCGCDWDSQCDYEHGDIAQSELKRHFWG